MPDLGKLGVPEYQPGQPYHYEYDNVPLKTLEHRDFVINAAVDNLTSILQDTAGTQGTLANRLIQSVDEDGNLKTSAVDQAMHSIAEHEDASKTVTPQELLDYQQLGVAGGGSGYPTIANPVPFVRMLEAERDKLALVADEATKLFIDVNTPSTIINFGLEGNPTLNLIESDTIAWNYTAPNSISADLKISTDYAHRPYYDVIPATVDNKNFSYSPYPIVAGSLRVHINGTRLTATDSVYYPNSTHTAWNLNSYTPNDIAGTFQLDNAITANDVIRVDFDISVT